MIKHVHLAECDSTQELAKEQLTSLGDQDEILVSCDKQLKGRGRGNNLWYSLPGSLCFSMTFAPNPTASLTAIELSLIISKFFEGSILSLKWPNDIWNKHQKKCCGVLVQNHQGRMIAGVGLNLFSEHPEFGGVYETSFELDKKLWSMELANFIYSNRFYDQKVLKTEWENKCAHLGSLVNISEGHDDVEGFFQELGNNGQAVVLTKEGVKNLYNGTLRIVTSPH
jgi:biotin-[acetyl-CoA-carboxylase] ligase BirA-like protein